MADLRTVNLPFWGDLLGGHFRLPVLPAGEVGQEKGDGFTHRFGRQQQEVPRPWP
jgi:hypothetical protein